MKDKKNTLAIIGLILSVLAAAAYAALYGFSTGSMNCMSWPAVWILGAGAVADAVLIFIARKPRFGAYIMALASLAAFCLSVYAFNTYISAAFVGIVIVMVLSVIISSSSIPSKNPRIQHSNHRSYPLRAYFLKVLPIMLYYCKRMERKCTRICILFAYSVDANDIMYSFNFRELISWRTVEVDILPAGT